MPRVKKEIINKIFGKGTVNTIGSDLIDRGASSGSTNFLTELDYIELVRGRKLMGAEEAGSDPVLGLHSAPKADGTEIMFRKIGTKLQYYNDATEAWVDAKTGLEDGEELHFDNSYTPAGRQVWACGQDGLFKIYPSSPASVLVLTDSSKNYKGKIKIEKSRMLCWGMREDPTGLRFSKVDKDANYTTVSGESVGALGSKNYVKTLANDQIFGVVVTDGTQTLTDDKNGNFTGDGTGMVNYATGEINVTFTNTTTGAVTASYLYEDPLSDGMADFRYSATRLAGEGNVQRQDATGAASHNVLTFDDNFYTLQDKGAFRVSIDTTDLVWSNEVYNTQIGTPNSKASVAIAEGIVFIDTFDSEKPKLRLLSYNQYGDKIIPYELSRNFKMEDYLYDKSAMIKFGDFIIFSCRTANSTINNKTIVYHLINKTFDVLNNGYDWFTIKDDKLYGGDSSSPNVYELFSGYDDLEYSIEGEWEAKNDNMDTEQLKKFKQFIIGGYISTSQGFEIYASFDNEDYEQIGSLDGTESVVQEGDSITVGSVLVGSLEVGGQGGETAYYFKKIIKVHTPKFDKAKIKFVPTGLGYLAVHEYKFSDIRLKGTKVLRKYKSVSTNREGIGFWTIGDTFIVS